MANTYLNRKAAAHMGDPGEGLRRSAPECDGGDGRALTARAHMHVLELGRNEGELAAGAALVLLALL